jgi:hypothetical protein
LPESPKQQTRILYASPITSSFIWSSYCNRFAQRVYRQRLCKHSDYATVEESSVFCATTIATQRWSKHGLVARWHCKRLDYTTARVGRGHVTSACSTVTQQ